ncbi:hypothetical protein ACWDX9_05240, partial [Nonomuraea sp. NPDC003201]
PLLERYNFPATVFLTSGWVSDAGKDAAVFGLGQPGLAVRLPDGRLRVLARPGGHGHLLPRQGRHQSATTR